MFACQRLGHDGAFAWAIETPATDRNGTNSPTENALDRELRGQQNSNKFIFAMNRELPITRYV
jgi:hypothetical protein